jgi:hypothetical protein
MLGQAMPELPPDGTSFYRYAGEMAKNFKSKNK